ncbi:MAG TPA: bifunctional oligoribonuclease/PAP phosphatase NrnA [Gemmatimonadota bacterium]|nr:bifunctional oligoribonuclease/PAP phosphatase NrnA [Gemmatimonadota bacterium]
MKGTAAYRPADAAAGDALQELLKGARRIVLTTHVQPDGDGIGSQVALARYLRGLGRQVTILNPHATPRRFRFLEPDPPIVPFEPAVAESVLERADLLVVLDISVPERLGGLEPIVDRIGLPVAVIDHHAGPSYFDGFDYRDSGAAATGEIIYRLFKEWGAEITPPIATALYAAIAYDTGGFRHSNTVVATHEIAADLFVLGADVRAVHHHLFESTSLATIRLMGRVFTDFELSAAGRLAWVVLSKKLMEEVGAETEDVEGVTEALRAIDGVIVAILFKEIGDRATKISFRSIGSADVNSFARRFGGGGHTNAAGAFVREPLAAVVERVVQAAQEAFDPAPAE